MLKKNYQNWEKQALIDEINALSKRKKYGLVWEDKLSYNYTHKFAQGKRSVGGGWLVHRSSLWGLLSSCRAGLAVAI